MKLMFVEARYNKAVFIGKHVLKLPEKIGLVTTVQFIGQVKEIKLQLEQEGKKVFFGKGKHAAYQAQVLGCDVNSALSVNNKVDAFLYIGSGLFHPTAISLKTKKDVFIFNPLTNKFNKIDREQAEKINKKNKGEKSVCISFSAHVSSGTYIRVLASDIAHALGTVGIAYAIVRTSVGEYDGVVE